MELGKHSSLGWIDNVTYNLTFDAEPETDKNGNEIKCWYEVEYHADEQRVVFVKTAEDSRGNCDSVDVANTLSKEVKEAIISVIREEIGDKLVLA